MSRQIMANVFPVSGIHEYDNMAVGDDVNTT